MKEIKLNKGYISLVNDEDYDWINQWHWSATFSHGSIYARTNRKDYDGIYRNIFMHRLIMDTPKDMQVDHIDHNGLNNQRSNLRNCNNQENHMNMRKRQHSCYQYHGVSFHSANGIDRFIARIMFNYKTINLGTFDTERDAAMAYDNKARELFGEFANLNFKS